MHVRVTVLALALGSLLLLAPSAMAHETYESDDGEYLITVGSQGEPVYTFQVTNVDLIIREHLGDGERGDEVSGVHQTLTATLIAPGGEEHTDELTTQFGSEGRYEFNDGYVLTQPGIYTLRLEGSINDTPVDGVYDLPHTIPSQSDIMFPDQGLPTAHDVAELQDRVAALETQSGDDNNDAPGPGALLLVGLLAFSVLLLRARAKQ